MSRASDHRPPPREKVSPWPFVGMAGMAAAFFLYAASIRFAPWWGVLGFMAVWALFLLPAAAWWTPHPRRVPWVALVAVVAWFALAVAAGVWLDWSV